MQRRTFLFACCTVGLAIVLCEGVSYTALAVYYRTWDVPGVTTAHERAVWTDPIPSSPIQEETNNEVSPHIDDESALHPYLGYVHIPKDSHIAGTDIQPLKSFGFGVKDGKLVIGPHPNMVVIGVFGGSVAENFMEDAEAKKRLADAVLTLPEFAGKEVVFSGVTIGGYKQPQQLLAYTYMLSMGAYFDIVITLDGFNDVALSPLENTPKGVNALFPRSWYFLAEQNNPALQSRTNHIITLRLWRSYLASAAHWRPFKWSFTEHFLWTFVDTLLDRHIAAITNALVAANASPTDYAATGPREPDMSSGAIIKQLVDVWKNGSAQMERLSKANGSLYFHFLQPNQWDAGSKPMGPEEKKIAFVNVDYKGPVQAGYPLLRAAGSQLQKEGVHFDDLSHIFLDHPEPLYIDGCCHFSPAGSHILADAMGAFILRSSRK